MRIMPHLIIKSYVFNQEDMESSFYKFYKEVLLKVSFSQQLLRKELKKGLQYLNREEKSKLIRWTKKTFGTLGRRTEP